MNTDTNYIIFTTIAQARVILRGLAIAVVIAVAALTAVAQNRTAGSGSANPVPLDGDGLDFGKIEGTWLITIDSGPGVPLFKGIHTYAAGGGMTETNQTDKQPPQQTTGQGSWAKLGPNVFGYTFIAFQYDANGVAVSTLKVRDILRMNSRDTFTGHGEVLICDTNVENCFSVGFATDHGVRLEVEAPDTPK